MGSEMCIRDRYIHAYIHTYMHPYVHTYMHAYIHTYIHTCIHTCIHTYMHACMHAYIHKCTYVLTFMNTYMMHAYIRRERCIQMHTYKHYQEREGEWRRMRKRPIKQRTESGEQRAKRA